MSNEVYDSDNIFAQILRGELPCEKVHENENVLAFHDKYPDAPEKEKIKKAKGEEK